MEGALNKSNPANPGTLAGARPSRLSPMRAMPDSSDARLALFIQICFDLWALVLDPPVVAGGIWAPVCIGHMILIVCIKVQIDSDSNTGAHGLDGRFHRRFLANRS